MVINVGIKNREYDILIEKGIFERLSQEIKNVYNGNKIMVVTDSTVDGFYGEKIIEKLKAGGFTPYKFVFKAGEESKNHTTLINLYSALAKYEIGRKDLIIAFGGGVTGDITGFAAATWQRGVKFIQIPTTLLAMVDSSVGGKTGINTTEGKNLVGAFYQPIKVIIDPLFLKTLDEKFFRDGIAEIIKYGCIWDSQLFDTLNKHNINTINENLESIICRCCEIKSEIVEKDEFDNSIRMILNFGHTVGHAIEKCQEYKGLTHGHAVAVGMNYITKRSELLNLTIPNTQNKIQSILVKYALPYIMPEIPKEQILKAIMQDKKGVGNEINITVINEIGISKVLKYKKDEMENFLYGNN